MPDRKNKAKLIEVTCGYCAARFTAKPSANRLYCSTKCRDYMRRSRPWRERFWENINTNGPLIRPTLGCCWPWINCKNRDGYGDLGRKVEGCRLAHRLAWFLARGPIPDGLLVLHKCDNPPCCNPAHLFLGTNADNMRDMAAKGRAGKGGNNRKLNEAQVKEIRTRHAAGENRTRIATEYGICKWSVTAIVARRTWAHVA